MAGMQDFVCYQDDFLGAGTFGTSASEGDDWLITDTSSAGTPTYVRSGTQGEAVLTMDSTSEVQNVSLDHGDTLNFDIDDLQYVEMRVKTVATLDSATTLTFGLRSARNDDPDATAANAQFKLAGSNAVVVETDDGTNDNDDTSTGKSLVATYQRFVIDFSGGTSDVKFYVNGDRVAGTTTFDMSNYTAGLQPFVQIQKTADTNTDSVNVDYVEIKSRRN
jgi:hypothetical protein